MTLKELTREDCEHAREWRNQCLETLRTPYALTKEMQSEFYDNVICNRNSPDRYWGVHDENDVLIGLGGVNNIQFENSIGEISLILDPEKRGNGLGTSAVEELLDKAFSYLGLKTVCGECYECNMSGVDFWKKIADRYNGMKTSLPNRKFWKGGYYPSLYFSIDREEFNKVKYGN